jgi:hydroxymethylglutaryl-CoA reductase (NADPH)
MTKKFDRAREQMDRVSAGRRSGNGSSQSKRRNGSAPPPLPRGSLITDEALEQRWESLRAAPGVRDELLDSTSRGRAAVYQRNIEHYVGTVRLPLGIAGPLRVNGAHAQGEYIVPLATTEAALVASYCRGAQLITACGGASAMLINEGVSRSPALLFANLGDLTRFLTWLLAHENDVRSAAEATTRFGKLTNLQVNVEGNNLYILMTYATGDAAGQNMATIASEAALQWILEHAPVKPLTAFVEANFSGDKKASAQSLLGVRGKKVTTELHVPARLVEEVLHTSAERMATYCRIATLGGVMSGTLGIQGHFANGLAALFIACGQDPACVAEAAVGTTRMELTPDGDLYAAVTMPNLIVGTVGGGTGLPSQRACLELLGLAGTGHARAFAEVAAALCLAGELSITGAICAGDFTSAHERLARGVQTERVAKPGTRSASGKPG